MEFSPLLVFHRNYQPGKKPMTSQKNVFSKTKDKKKEKDGVTTEVHVKIESTPVIKDNLGDYEGNYWYKDLRYKLEIGLANFIPKPNSALPLSFLSIKTPSHNSSSPFLDTRIPEK